MLCFTAWRAFALLCLTLLVPAALIAGGVIDPPQRGAGSARTVAGSLVLYWLLASVLLGVLANYRVRRRQLIAGGLSLVLSVIAAEVALRILSPRAAMMRATTVQSPRFHHLYPPNRDMYAGRYDGKHVYVNTNEDGLRTRYSRADYLGHPTRIAILGDSFTFGLGVREAATFPAVLERELRISGDGDVAVLNTGIPSFSPFLEDLLYERVVRHYQPDLVLLVLDATDFGDDYRYAGEASEDRDGVLFDQSGHKNPPAYRGALWQALNLGELAAWPLDFAQGLRPYRYYRFDITVDGVHESDRYFIYRHPLAKTRPYLDETMRNIERIAHAVERDGGRFVLVVSPRYHHWNQNECPRNWEGTYEVDEPFQFEYLKYFASRRAEAAFPMIDLLPAFQATEAFPLVFPNDPHWNEAGHRFVAATLAAALERAGLLQ
ncbi:MAG: hypothetical protein AAF628_17030 [Planctomycetota bacterium]